MKFRSFVIWMMLPIIFGIAGLVHAQATITRVTSNSYADRFPGIEGDYVVWQAFVEDDWEIFHYNIVTGVTTQITTDDTEDCCDDLAPQTDGHYVVWQRFNDGEWDIFLWDGGEPQVISDRGTEDISPQIADGLIVWTSEPFGDDFVGPSEIILYDVRTQTPTVLSAQVDPGNTLDDRSPRINREVVIWVQGCSQCDTTLYTYDISAGTISDNADYVWRDSPQTDGDLRVLTKRVGQDSEIFLHDGRANRYHQITANSFDDRGPTISGNHVAWMAVEEIFLAKVQYLGLVRPVDGKVLPSSPAPTFKWEAIGYDACNVACSKDPNFAANTTLTLPLEGDKTLSDISYTPTSSEWQAITAMERESGYVYWRVKGEDEGADSAYSETWSFTIRADGDNAGGPSCFIDTAANSFGWRKDSL